MTPALAAGVALGLAGSMRLIENGSWNYADTAVASFTALGLLCALVWLSRGASPMLALSALFFAAAASTKAEGLLFALAALAAVLATARGFGRPLRSVGWFAGAVLVVPVTWAVTDRLNGPGAQNVDRATLTDPRAMLDASGRIPDAAWRLLSESWNGWPLACAFVAAAVVAASLVRLWWHVAFVVLWGLLAFDRARRRVLRERLPDRLAPGDILGPRRLLGRARARHVRARARRPGLGQGGRSLRSCPAGARAGAPAPFDRL